MQDCHRLASGHSHHLVSVRCSDENTRAVPPLRPKLLAAGEGATAEWAERLLRTCSRSASKGEGGCVRREAMAILPPLAVLHIVRAEDTPDLDARAEDTPGIDARGDTLAEGGPVSPRSGASLAS